MLFGCAPIFVGSRPPAWPARMGTLLGSWPRPLGSRPLPDQHPWGLAWGWRPQRVGLPKRGSRPRVLKARIRALSGSWPPTWWAQVTTLWLFWGCDPYLINTRGDSRGVTTPRSGSPESWGHDPQFEQRALTLLGSRPPTWSARVDTLLGVTTPTSGFWGSQGVGSRPPTGTARTEPPGDTTPQVGEPVLLNEDYDPVIDAILRKDEHKILVFRIRV